MDIGAARTMITATGPENAFVDDETRPAESWLIAPPRRGGRVAWVDHDIERLPGGDPHTGKLRFRLPKLADFLTDLWVKVEVDAARYKLVNNGRLTRAVPVASQLGGEPVSMPFSDLILVRRAQLRVGAQVIEEIDGTALAVQRVLAHPHDPYTTLESYSSGDSEVWVHLPFVFTQPGRALPSRAMEQQALEVHLELEPAAPVELVPRRAAPTLVGKTPGLLPEQMQERYMAAKAVEDGIDADSPAIVQPTTGGGYRHMGGVGVNIQAFEDSALAVALGDKVHLRLATTATEKSWRVQVDAPPSASVQGVVEPLVLTSQLETVDDGYTLYHYEFSTSPRNPGTELLRTDFGGVWRMLMSDIQALLPYPESFTDTDYTPDYMAQVSLLFGAYRVTFTEVDNDGNAIADADNATFYVVTTPPSGLTFDYGSYNGGATLETDQASAPLWPSYTDLPQQGDLPAGVDIPILAYDEVDGKLVPATRNGAYRRMTLTAQDPFNPVGTVRDARLVGRYILATNPSDALVTDLDLRFLEHQTLVHPVPAGSTELRVGIDFVGVHSDLFFFFRPSQAEHRFDTLVAGQHPFSKAQLLINGRPVHDPPRPANYFHRPREFPRAALRIDGFALYACPFGYDHSDPQIPTGSLNYDAVDRVELVLTAATPMHGELVVVGRRFNVFTIAGGVGGRRFA